MYSPAKQYDWLHFNEYMYFFPTHGHRGMSILAGGYHNVAVAQASLCSSYGLCE